MVFFSIFFFSRYCCCWKLFPFAFCRWSIFCLTFSRTHFACHFFFIFVSNSQINLLNYVPGDDGDGNQHDNDIHNDWFMYFEAFEWTVFFCIYFIFSFRIITHKSIDKHNQVLSCILKFKLKPEQQNNGLKTWYKFRLAFWLWRYNWTYHIISSSWRTRSE